MKKNIADLTDIIMPNIRKSITIGEPLPKLHVGDCILIIARSCTAHCVVSVLKDFSIKITFNEPEDKAHAEEVNEQYLFNAVIEQWEPLTPILLEHFARKSYMPTEQLTPNGMNYKQALIKLQRHYGIRHCMVEGKYLTVKEFCAEVLQVLGYPEN